uniref:NADH-ubiquinone oxidoreductase chain 6 n=1 Tax=Ciidae sp. GENSP01 TaxID=1205545 RepID=A0A0S2MSA0_9CUCU|nr:NADH deshydrogenase subunit 6 [Ciidae sp. GENSP01]
MSMMISLSMTISMILFLLTHPLSLGLALLIQTTLSSLLIAFISPSSWYSYMLFIVMIGGMMVLFIYMTSIASNEKFLMNTTIIILATSTMVITLIMLTKMNFAPPMNKSSFNEELLVNLFNKWWSNPLNLTSSFLFMYLLMAMIATIKITSFNNGPLRQLN